MHGAFHRRPQRSVKTGAEPAVPRTNQFSTNINPTFLTVRISTEGSSKKKLAQFRDKNIQAAGSKIIILRFPETAQDRFTPDHFSFIFTEEFQYTGFPLG